MKRVLLAMMLSLFAFAGNTQVIVEEVNINELDIKYVELVGRGKAFSLKMKIIVDYGQEFSFKSQAIRSADGTKAEFNSMIDALNFMDANGWELISNYVVRTDTEVTVRYILHKKGS